MQTFIRAALLISILSVTPSMILGVTHAVAQENESNIAIAKANKLQPWIGKWSGEATNELAGKDKQNFSVQLFVSPGKSPNRWNWQITYTGAAGKSVRDYELVAVDESKGQYVLDEKNGIQLPATLFEDSLHFHFSVSGQTLWSRYRLLTKEKTVIEYELVTASSQDAKTTGTPELEVIGLQPVSRQFATLKPMVDKPIVESNGAENSGK